MRIGIDLGGTKTYGVALDRDGRVRASKRIDTPRHDYDAIVRAVVDVVRELEARVGERCSVGVGMPGCVSTVTGLVKGANTVVLIGRPFDRDLSAALARPVHVENDANCFALSEAADSAAAGASVVFGVIVAGGLHPAIRRGTSAWGTWSTCCAGPSYSTPSDTHPTPTTPSRPSTACRRHSEVTARSLTRDPRSGSTLRFPRAAKRGDHRRRRCRPGRSAPQRRGPSPSVRRTLPWRGTRLDLPRSWP